MNFQTSFGAAAAMAAISVVTAEQTYAAAPPASRCADFANFTLLSNNTYNPGMSDMDNRVYLPTTTFDAGDTLEFRAEWVTSVSTRTVNEMSLTLWDASNNSVIYGPTNSPGNEGDQSSGTTLFAPVVLPVATPGETYVLAKPTFTGGNFAATEVTYYLKCTPASTGGGGGGPTPSGDSSQLDSVQQAASAVSAQLSSEIITDSTGGAIADALSGQIQVLSASDGKVGLQWAPGLRSGATRITPTADVSGDLTSDSALRFWLDGRYTDWNSAGLDGDQFNGLAGVSLLVGNGMVAGLALGYEDADYDTATGAELDGDGFSAGLYAGGALSGNFRFDAQVHGALLGYDVRSGAVTGDFDATRLVASAGLSHLWTLGPLTIEPTLRATGTWEWQDGYVDSAAVVHASRDINFGRVSLGSKISHAVAMGDGGTFTPYILSYSDYRFSSGDMTTDSALDGLSHRLGAGFDVRMNNGISAGILGEVYGLGLDHDALAKSIKGQVAIPF